MDDEDLEEMRALRGRSSERFDFIHICFILHVFKSENYIQSRRSVVFALKSFV